jgi:hypothetical protein
VRFRDGSCAEIVPYEWNVMDGKIVLASRRQIPLRLAYGITIHRCQGKTLDQAEIDIRHVFAPAMVFVALSRVRSLQDVRIRNLDPAHIFPIPTIVSEFQRRFVSAASLCKRIGESLTLKRPPPTSPRRPQATVPSWSGPAGFRSTATTNFLQAEKWTRPLPRAPIISTNNTRALGSYSTYSTTERKPYLAMNPVGSRKSLL